jgi:hypothetical protein
MQSRILRRGIRAGALATFVAVLTLVATVFAGQARAELITPHAATPETVTPHEVAPAPAAEPAPAPAPQYAEPAPEYVAPSNGGELAREVGSEADAAGSKNRRGDGSLPGERNEKPILAPTDTGCEYKCLGDWLNWTFDAIERNGSPFTLTPISIDQRISIMIRRVELEIAAKKLEEELTAKWAKTPQTPAPAPTADGGNPKDGDDAPCRNGSGNEAEDQVEDRGSGSDACR